MSEGCQLQRRATVLSTGQPVIRRGPRARFALLFFPATLLGAAGSCLAQDAAEKADATREEVVIRANRADEVVTREVQKTLSESPMVFAKHLTVTTENGVVRIEGMVQDTGELFRILDLARKVAGAKRVVDAMQIIDNIPDGG